MAQVLKIIPTGLGADGFVGWKEGDTPKDTQVLKIIPERIGRGWVLFWGELPEILGY